MDAQAYFSYCLCVDGIVKVYTHDLVVYYKCPYTRSYGKTHSDERRRCCKGKFREKKT